MKEYFQRGRESRRQTTGRVWVFATANTEMTKGRAERQGLGQSPNKYIVYSRKPLKKQEHE